MGRADVLTRRDYAASLGWSSSCSSRAKWRSSPRVRVVVCSKMLDTADIVREAIYQANALDDAENCSGSERGIEFPNRISNMTRLVAATVLLAAAFGSTNLARCQHNSKVEKITGRIVAYSSFLLPTCLNGNGYWSMLIRVEDRSSSLPAKIAEVQFSLPCEKRPEWLEHKQSVQKFRLVRQVSSDSVLKEFYECSPESTGKCPQLRMWRLVPGAEDEKLPFGQSVPSYRSMDLPLAPVL